jgi:hypothetical protein
VVDCIRRGGEEELRVVNSWGRAGRERFKDEKSREEREREREGTEDLRLGRDECTRDDVTLWDDTSSGLESDARSNVMMMAWSVG